MQGKYEKIERGVWLLAFCAALALLVAMTVFRGKTDESRAHTDAQYVFARTAPEGMP